MPRCNLIALGEERVGKTSLLSLLMGREFIENRDPTCGIDNERVDVIESRTVSSETWEGVNPDDLARKHDNDFANSVAEEFRSHFTSASKPSKTPPTREALAAAISDIEKYLREVEEAAQRPPPPLCEVVFASARDIPLTSTVPKRVASASIPRPSSTPKGAEPSSTDYKPARPQISQPRAASRPKPETRPEKEENPQPPLHPQHSEVQQPLPERHEVNTRRQSDISLRMNKSIISAAKRGPKVVESVLQYNTLDFAGQRDYRAMHHCFIVRRAIYLVVFNLQIIREALTASTTESKRALEEIQYWLNSIHAHIHKIAPEPFLKRVLLVGTHRAPKGKERVTEENMHCIDEALKRECIRHRVILNDLYCADPTDQNWFAAIESSIDGTEESARKESGASSLQKAIHQAWNDLPFKDEEYPTTWLRFEAFLIDHRKQNTPIVEVAMIRKVAREYGIGEEDEGGIELALGFFHDTGTIVYLSKLLLNSSFNCV